MMLNYFEERKETFLTIKNKIFQSPKNRIFLKELTHVFGQNMQFFNLILIKISLETMLSDFAEKKNLFDLKKQNFSNSKISHFFKGVNPYFWPKNAIFFLYLDLIKIRLEIMLSDFDEKKETFSGFKQHNL